MLKVKEYSSFEAFEQDEHRQDVDLVAIVNKPNGMVCADLITDCKMWQTAVNRLTAGRNASRKPSRVVSGRKKKRLMTSTPAAGSGKLKTSMTASTFA